ncbi:MAG: hypothetical protein M3044_04680 [Thermoproteota archaeon]|nr:hypothetical protein [Thermoproteota archaeon]
MIKINPHATAFFASIHMLITFVAAAASYLKTKELVPLDWLYALSEQASTTIENNQSTWKGRLR